MSSPSPLLRLELQEAGENLNTWGHPRLNNALQRLEEAAHGITTITLSPADGTAGTRPLASTNYAADEARAPLLVIAGTPGGDVEIMVPSIAHWWLVDNRVSDGSAVTLATAGGAAVTLRPGTQWIICDGTDAIGVTPRLDQLPPPTAAVDLTGQRLVNLGAPVAAADAVNKAYVDTFAIDRDAGGFRLVNLAAPVAAADAVNKAYVDTFAIDRDAGGFRLVNLAAPVAAADAVNKQYADAIVVSVETAAAEAIEAAAATEADRTVVQALRNEVVSTVYPGLGYGYDAIAGGEAIVVPVNRRLDQWEDLRLDGTLTIDQGRMVLRDGAALQIGAGGLVELDQGGLYA